MYLKNWYDICGICRYQSIIKWLAIGHGYDRNILWFSQVHVFSQGLCKIFYQYVVCFKIAGVMSVCCFKHVQLHYPCPTSWLHLRFSVTQNTSFSYVMSLSFLSSNVWKSGRTCRPEVSIFSHFDAFPYFSHFKILMQKYK